MNISKSDYSFFLSINPNKKPLVTKKIRKELSKIDIKNLIILDDDMQYESTIEEIQSSRLLSKDSFCSDSAFDDLDLRDNFPQIILEMRLDDNTLLGFSLFNFKFTEKQTYIYLLCANPKYKKVGTALVNMIKEITTKLDYDEIQLNSVTDAVDFYLKMNFKCDNDKCILEDIKSGEVITVNTSSIRKSIEKGYLCPDNNCLLVYKIKAMNLEGGRRKTIKRRTYNL
jgi:hypothetical protein